MLNLGHSHPDFTYANDRQHALLTLGLLVPVSILCCLMIVAAVLSM